MLVLLDDPEWTWAEIEEETDVNQGTMKSIRDRKEQYIVDAHEHDNIELPDELEATLFASEQS